MYAAWLFWGDRFKDIYFPDIENWNVSAPILQAESGWPVDITLQFRAFENQVFLALPQGFLWFDGGTGAEREIKPENQVSLTSPYGSVISIILARIERSSLQFTKYRGDHNVVTIGRLPQNVICDTDENNSGDHGYLDLRNSSYAEYTDHSSNGTYLNSRRVHNNTIRLQFGDTLSWPSGLKIIFLGDILAINHITSLTHVKLQLFQPPAIEKEREPENLPSLYVEYHRAPRILLRPDVEEIEIEPPTAKQQQSQTPLWLQVGPSSTMMMPMLLGTLAGSFVSANGLSAADAFRARMAGLVMIGTSSVLSVMWGLINRKYRKKSEAEEEARRIALYQKYIAEMETSLQELNNREYQRLMSTFPNVGDYVDMPVDGTLRLWNRMPSHPDFLDIRVGLGVVDLPSTIAVPKQKLSVIDDPLRDEPDRLKKVYSVIADAPVTVELRREAVIGVLGSDEAMLFVQGLMMQIAAMHSYHDVRIAVLTDETASSNWQWCRWLPHIFANEDRDMRMLASRPSAIHDVMNHISDVLIMRRSAAEEQENASRGDSEDFDPRALPLPHYIIICTNSKLLENEPVLRHLLNNRLGMTLVMMAPSMELLPKECHLIFNVASKPGFLHTSDGDTRQVDFEYPNRELLATFSHNLAPLRVKDATESAAIPTLVSFLDIYGVRRVSDLDVWRMWTENRTYDGIRSIIGYAAGSQPFTLDISDKYHGPHGLIAGTTGSGKSVMLQTYILSLALNYSPEEVQFILIDYKGGGMADAFRTLPHVAGIIDNLQGEVVINRALASLNGEIHRRERIFKTHDVSNINEYSLNFGNDPAEPTLPHLIIIVDEFAELKSDQPEFMQELVSASRVGRSLGVHLILATQKPSNSVSDEIWANSRFHLCLRVQTRSDSMEMLKRPDAAYIKGMGRCFIQIGNDELFEQVQTSYSGLTYNPDEPRPEEMPHLLGDAGQPVRTPRLRKTGADDNKKKKTQMDAVLERIREVAGQHELLRSRQMWLPQLPQQICYSELKLYADTVYRGGRYINAPENITFLLGLADDVARQQYVPCVMDLTLNRNLMIVGLAGSGKTTAVQSIVTSLCGQYDPAHLNIYLLSFTSATLGKLSAFPQVGDILYENDVVETKRFINMLFDEQQRRSERFAEHATDSFIEYNRACRDKGMEIVPAIVVFVDRFEQLKNMFINDDYYTARIHQLIREGSSRGIHFIVTGLARNEVPPKLQPFFSGIALQLRERIDYSDVLGKRVPTDMPPISPNPGRGMVLIGDPAQPFEIQLAVGSQPPAVDPDAPFGDFSALGKYVISSELPARESLNDSTRSDQISEFASRLKAEWKGALPKRVPRIPEDPDLEKFMATPGFDDIQANPVRLPIGYDMVRGDLASIDIEKNYAMFVTGPKKSGRSNLLKFIARLFAMRGAEIHVYGNDSWKKLAKEIDMNLYTTEDEMARFIDFFVSEYPAKRKPVRDKALADSRAAARKVMTEQFKPCVVIIDDADRLVKGFTETRFNKSPVVMAYESQAQAQKAEEENQPVPPVKTAEELAPGQNPKRNVPAKKYIADIFAQMAANGAMYNLYLFMSASHNERGNCTSDPLKTIIAQGHGIELGGRLNDYDPLQVGSGMTMQLRSRALPVGMGYVVTEDGSRQIVVPLVEQKDD